MFVGSFAPVNSAGQLKDDSGVQFWAHFVGFPNPPTSTMMKPQKWWIAPKVHPPIWRQLISPTHLWYPSVNTEFDVENPPGFCMDFPNGYVIYPKVSQLGIAARPQGNLWKSTGSYFITFPDDFA